MTRLHCAIALLACSTFALGQRETGAPRGASAGSPNLSPHSSDQVEITDVQRGSITVTAYDLQLHLTPSESSLNAIARLTVRNDGSQPLPELPMQLSSTLHWDAVSGRTGLGAAERLQVQQHRIDTDTDHTGAASEAIIKLVSPLAPGHSVDLVVAYSGTVEPSAARLVRAGESIDAASNADWDAIGPERVALRGFGNVLWYPVAAPQAFVEDGLQLSITIGAERRREMGATVRLRLEVEGGKPAVGFFCGREARFSQVNAGEARGGEADSSVLPMISTAEWPAAPLGFGAPSLFVSDDPLIRGEGVVAVAGGGAGERKALEDAASAALPLVTGWLGEAREREPMLLDQLGEPFAQRALLVESAREAAAPFPMTHLESHAWFSSPEVWLDEGVAQFLPLVAVEQAEGRGAALAHLRDLQPALSLAETQGGNSKGEPLVAASREVFYRNKAVAVLWMLRSIAGDAAIKRALQALKQQPEAQRTAVAFERSLEAASGKDLGWFFNDWVLEDHGLPDLSIVNAAARPFNGAAGRPDGDLVAVEVRNDGHAAAEVPVTVRSGTLTATERLRVPAMGTASIRIPFQGTPEQVELNDGTVPEVGTSEHEQTLAPPSAPPLTPP